MSKSIYVGVMTGTSCDAIDVSFISISKKVNLEFFHSIKIPKKTQTEIKNLIASNETSLSSLGKINKDIGEILSSNRKIYFAKWSSKEKYKRNCPVGANCLA